MSSTTEPKRVRPDGRSKNPRRMRESANDRVIVQYLYQYGMLSQVQFERLLERSRSTVQRLLRRLYDHHYLERLFFPKSKFGSSPALYILDHEGYALLRRLGIEDFAGLPRGDFSANHLNHLMAISEVHLAVEKACKNAGYKLTAWLTDNQLRSRDVKMRVYSRRSAPSLIPDGYFAVSIPNVGTTHCFLELDRGMMSIPRFTEKVRAYIEFYKSEQFAKHFGAKGFRVLTVVDAAGEGRVNNLKNATARVPAIGRRFWFAHLNGISAETVLAAPIWSIADGESNIPLIVI